MTLNTTSKIFTFLPDTSGSSKLVHREQVAIPARQTETVETLAAAKNKIQWAAISTPVPSMAAMSLSGSRKFLPLTTNNTASPIDANSVR